MGVGCGLEGEASVVRGEGGLESAGCGDAYVTGGGVERGVVDLCEGGQGTADVGYGFDFVVGDFGASGYSRQAKASPWRSASGVPG